MRYPGTFYIGFFEFGQGHRGPMIPYCPGAPCVVSPPLIESKRKSQILGCPQKSNRGEIFQWGH
ncbi:unnamed protein product [Staurois parvus]|uniref:Uncharacterized protein n=1 Tax=Staurois parvus TaxID=386267 RepID=A0ABN9FHN5_9NEOB|nr:unnamed protein product [Staurois parvus]